MKTEQSIISSIRFLITLHLFIFVFHYTFIADFSNIVNSFMSVTIEIKLLNSLLMLILGLDLFTTYKAFCSNVNNVTKKYYFNIFIALIITTISFIWFLYNGSDITIWTDEVNQFSWAAVSPITASGIQYQVPLSYYQSYSGELLFNDRRIALRFHTYLNYALALSLMFLIIKNLTNKYLYSLLAIALCCTNFSMIYSSVNARPQSISFLFVLLFINEIWIINKLSSLNLKQFISLSCITSLLLLSIGLQPPFFILIFTTSYLILFYKNHSLKKHASLFVAITLGALSFIPFQLFTIKISSSKFYASDTLTIIKRNLTQFKWFDFDKLNLFHFSGYFYFSIVAICLLTSYYYLNKNKGNSLNFQTKYIFYIFTGNFIFIILLFNFYKINVNYFFDHRYAFLFYPIFFLSLSLLIAHIFSNFKNNSLLQKITQIILLISLIAPLKLHSYSELKKNKPWSLFDSEKIYSKVVKTIPHETIIYCLSANWGHTYKNCSGIEHINSAYKIRDRNKSKKNQKFKNYQIYPTWDGNWGPDLDSLSDTKFSFMFMSLPSTLIQLKNHLKIQPHSIENNVYQAIITVESNTGKEAYMLLKKVKDFLDANNEYQYKPEFKIFLEKQKFFDNH